jgi:bifunctional enzyme CysN/CysC
MAALNIGQEFSADGREDMQIVIVGHVDHGKSTIIGRLLADTGSLPDGKLEFVKETCRRNAKPFEYAFLLDALKDEQAQGITIDVARSFFKTAKRNYIIIDAPGHIEFLKNMVTGAARAEAAFLVIDATEGVQENSRRHGYMLSLLGIRQVAVLINKMDLENYKEDVFKRIRDEYLKFLEQIGIEPCCFIPVSGMQGDNIAFKADNMPWYSGQTALEVLDSFEGEKTAEEKPFRMPVQGVYKFTRDGDNRRIIAGTVEAGRLKVGDVVIFYPSGKTGRVKSIEAFNEERKEQVGAGYATGFTLSEQIFVSRGELATVAGQLKPGVTSRVRANIFWLGKEPLRKEKEYLLKLGTARIGAYLEQVTRVIDASSLDVLDKEQVDKHDVAECIFKLDRDIAFDPPDLLVTTSRFVVVDNYEIAGGGIVEEALPDSLTENRAKVHLRNIKWEMGYVEADERAERNSQKATLILVTGKKEMNRKQVAKALERKLFEEGKQVYFFSMGNLLYGIDADIKTEVKNSKREHFRRLAEVANMMLDAGLILIVSVIELTREDVWQLSLGVDYARIEVVWLGEEVVTDVDVGLHITDLATQDKTVATVKEYMQKKGIIFRPW